MGVNLIQTIVSKPSGTIGLGLTVLHELIALLAPVIASYNPTMQNADAILLAPNAEHWMGTGSLGQDVFSRVIHGSYLAISVTFAAAVIATLWGGFAGIFFGAVGGRVDENSMRIVAAFLSMLWSLFLLLIISIGGAGPATIIPTLGFFYGVAILRVVRGAAMQVATRDYVTTARARGEKIWLIISREMFPYLSDTRFVEGAMQWIRMLLAFSSRSFLGFGATPPTPDWGLMVAQQRSLISTAPLPSPFKGTDITDPLIKIEDLSIGFTAEGGRRAPILRGVSLELNAGETIGIGGESGSGKSKILRAIAGLVSPRAGSITLNEGENLAASVSRRDRETLRKVQMSFQNADASLNPRQTIAEILSAPLQLYFGLEGQAARDKAKNLLQAVRLPERYLDRFPGQLSGGEKQRVGVACAFAASPEVILCDEVTNALDVSVQAAARAAWMISAPAPCLRPGNWALDMSSTATFRKMSLTETL
ncbi:ATP-binding cassette domain-containing protein [Falsiruegeria mediterranea]|uniref:Oligopeptide transport ATP-binding protein OppF n=1 Tax=Falsiruegeria mediterranea M17 TaxID=1200281 RepID=A0A2R8C9B6_9RHOB|nr:ATP-binding cassette domain-containing protein [Falsiruegeria mediterranea]SPJ28973.1 Oligopeptide transport ATP-binding protein OppF [Falsiruegeria mediterranea M17]